MRSSLLAVLSLAMFAGPLAPGQVAKEGEGYRIKLNYVAGRKTRYVATTNVVITGGSSETPPTKTESTIEEEVLKVENGIATVRTTLIGAPAGAPPTQTFQIDERGKMIGVETDPMSGMQSGYPDRALSSGETWTTEADVEAGGKARTSFKFVGLVKVEDRTLAQLDFKTTLDGPSSAEQSGSVFLDPADGRTVSLKTETKTTIATPGKKEATIVRVVMEMKRV